MGQKGLFLFFFFPPVRYFLHFQRKLSKCRSLKQCISFPHTQAEVISDWKISHWNVSETKFIIVLRRVAGRNLTWVLFSTKTQTLPFFGCSEKEKQKHSFPRRSTAAFWTDVVILHVQETYGLLAFETAQRSPPAMGMWAQHWGFSSERPETTSSSPSCLGATSPGCLQSKSNHIWLQAKFRKLDYLSPPTRWEMAGWGERGGRSEKLTQALKMLWNCNMHL